MPEGEFIDTSDILRLSETDREYAEWQESNTMPEFNWNDVKASRAVIEAWNTEVYDALGNSGTIFNISMRDGHQTNLLVYNATSNLEESPATPLIVLLHGGAFVSSDPRELAQHAIALAGLFHATVVIPAYRLAPEHPFPVAQRDVWDTLTWLESCARSAFNADLSRGFVLGGVSAGANIAAALCQRWSEKLNGRHPITGLWLSMPFVFSKAEDVPESERYTYLSRVQNATFPMNGEISRGAIEAQKPDYTSSWYSPFNGRHPHQALALHGVRVYIQASGQDSYRDDALIYERILRKNGVDTRYDVYPGLPHAHFAILPSLSASKRCNLDTIQQFGWLLHQDIATEEVIYRSGFGRYLGLGTP